MAKDLSEVEVLVGELESRLDRLRALYEQYFLGYEKLEPLVPRKDVERRFDVLRRAQFRNTAMRFRFQQTQQKYNTYVSYWGRILRQIEAGTYIRHVNRAKARKPEAAREVEVEFDLTEDVEAFNNFDDVLGGAEASSPKLLEVDDPFASASMKAAAIASANPKADAPAKPQIRIAAAPGSQPSVTPKGAPIAGPAKPSIALKSGPGLSVAPTIRTVQPSTAAPAIRPAQPSAAAPAIRPAQPSAAAPAIRPAQPSVAAPKPAQTGQGNGLEEKRIREIYTQYVQEKRAHKESTADITYEKIAQTVRDSSAALAAKHKGKAIDFEVTQRDGKTVLKPVVK